MVIWIVDWREEMIYYVRDISVLCLLGFWGEHADFGVSSLSIVDSIDW